MGDVSSLHRISWTGLPGKITGQCKPVPWRVKPYDDLLEIESHGIEHLATCWRLEGVLEWLAPHGPLYRGMVIAKVRGRVVDIDQRVTTANLVQRVPQPTRYLPLPYALTTHTVPKSYRITDAEIVYIREQAEMWGLDVGEMLRAIVHNWGTQTFEGQGGAVRRFQEAMRSVHNGETMST